MLSERRSTSGELNLGKFGGGEKFIYMTLSLRLHSVVSPNLARLDYLSYATVNPASLGKGSVILSAVFRFLHFRALLGLALLGR
jgi:hypothetical protein